MSSEIKLDHDTRIIKRNIAKGLISRAAVDAIVKDLPDMAEHAEFLDPDRPEPEEELAAAEEDAAESSEGADADEEAEA